MQRCIFPTFIMQELVFSASPDQTIRVWGIQSKSCAHVIRAHEGPVSGISLHATGDYLLSSGADCVSIFSIKALPSFSSCFSICVV